MCVNIRGYITFGGTFGIVLEMELKGLEETSATPELLPHDLTLQNDGDIETTLSTQHVTCLVHRTTVTELLSTCVKFDKRRELPVLAISTMQVIY